jgi:enoyl-[acyl-carrier-protein] reductase (NADH)
MVADLFVPATLRAPFADVDKAFAFFTLQKVLPLLGTGSSVIFNSAVSARKGVSNWSVYTATKGALLSMARVLAVELAPRGIRVTRQVARDLASAGPRLGRRICGVTQARRAPRLTATSRPAIPHRVDGRHLQATSR